MFRPTKPSELSNSVTLAVALPAKETLALNEDWIAFMSSSRMLIWVSINLILGRLVVVDFFSNDFQISKPISKNLSLSVKPYFCLMICAASDAVFAVRYASSLLNLSCSNFKASVFEITFAFTAVSISGRFSE